MPLRSDNRLAAILALAGLAVFCLGLFLPFVSVTKLVSEEVHSLPGSIFYLYDKGYPAIAAVVLVFSILFPLFKFGCVLAGSMSAFGLSPHLRQRLRAFVHFFGKYSMLDIFVVALFIVETRVGALVNAKIHAGLYLFLVAILLSFLAGHLMERPLPAGENASAPITRRQMLLGSCFLFLLALGLIAGQTPSLVEIDAVRLERLPESGLRELLNVFGDPDLYLEIHLRNKGVVQTAHFRDTPIGNGLTWRIFPAPLAEIAQVDVLEEGALFSSGGMLDRVEVRGRVNEGERFRLTLLERRGLFHYLSRALAVLGGVGTLLVALGVFWGSVLGRLAP